jgi:hypothetical protein
MNHSFGAGEIIEIIILIVLYLLPTIIAVRKKHHKTVAIAIFNIVLSWSVLGWIAALFWSMATGQPVAQQPAGEPSNLSSNEQG